MKRMERNEESLCEKSMKVVSNVIMISALSIAKRSLASNVANHVASKKNSHHQQSSSSSKTSPITDVVRNEPLFRAQQPQTNIKQTYLVDPKGGVVNKSSSSHFVKEDMNVDGKASDFIRKVHERNHKDVVASSESPSYKQLRSRVV